MPALLAVPLIAAVVEWGTAALAAYGLARLFSDESVSSLVVKVEAWAVSVVAHHTGLQLSEENPFSDASMAGAVGQRIGVPLRSLKDMALIREDLDGFAAAVIEEKSGYRIRSIQNMQILREDLLQIGMAEFSGRMGIPLGVMPGNGVAFDAVAVKENILSWAEAELLTKREGDVQAILAEITASGGVVAVAEQMNSALAGMGSVERVTQRQLAVRVAEILATNAVVNFNKVAKNAGKRDRRRESLRVAQAKFRAVHGNRQKYVPLGMSAVVG